MLRTEIAVSPTGLDQITVGTLDIQVTIFKTKKNRMGSNMKIEEVENFIKFLYEFNVHYGKYLDVNESSDTNKEKESARLYLNLLLGVTLSHGDLKDYSQENDFNNWLRWNYYTILDWIDVLSLDEDGKPIKNLVILKAEIRERYKELNKVIDTTDFNENASKILDIESLLNEFKQSLRIISKPTLSSKNKDRVFEISKSHFVSIIRTIVSSKNRYWYEKLKTELEKYYAELVNIFKGHNCQLELRNEWNDFLKNSEIVFPNEEKLENTLRNVINLKLEEYSIRLHETFLQQIYRKAGEFYDKIKGTLKNIRDEAFELSSILTNPIRHPIDTAKNLGYAISHPLETAKDAWEWVKDNPKKTLAVGLGAIGAGISIGLIIGFTGGIAFGVFAGSAGIVASEVLVAAGVASLLGIGGGLIGGALAGTAGIAAASANAQQLMLEHADTQIKAELEANKKLILDNETESILIEKEARKAAREAKRKHRERKAQEEKKDESELNEDTKLKRDEFEKGAENLKEYRDSITAQLIELNERKQTINIIKAKQRENFEKISKRQRDCLTEIEVSYTPLFKKSQILMPTEVKNFCLKQNILGFTPIEGDGNCFFRAVLSARGEPPENHIILRLKAISYMMCNADKFKHIFSNDKSLGTLEEYIGKMSQQGVWADGPIIEATALCLNCKIDLIDLKKGESGNIKPPTKFTVSSPESAIDDILLLRVNDNHYHATANTVFASVDEQTTDTMSTYP